MFDWLLPELSASTQAFIRAGYGVLMLVTLAQALPEARRFFLSERWGGYAKSSRAVDAIQNPFVMPALLALWVAAAVAITMGWGGPWPALVNLALCRYFFIHMRWKGVLRGMGAPGFMAYWTGVAVFLLEYTSHLAPNLRSLALARPAGGPRLHHAVGRRLQGDGGLPAQPRHGARPLQPDVGILVALVLRAFAAQHGLLDDEPARVGNRGGRRADDALPAHPRAGRAAARCQLSLHPHPDSPRVPVRDGHAQWPAVRRPRRDGGRVDCGAHGASGASRPGRGGSGCRCRQRGARRGAVGVPDRAAARARRPLLQLLRASIAGRPGPAAARALHEPVRHHHLARVLRGPRELLHPGRRASRATEERARRSAGSARGRGSTTSAR